MKIILLILSIIYILSFISCKKRRSPVTLGAAVARVAAPHVANAARTAAPYVASAARTAVTTVGKAAAAGTIAAGVAFGKATGEHAASRAYGSHKKKFRKNFF